MKPETLPTERKKKIEEKAPILDGTLALSFALSYLLVLAPFLFSVNDSGRKPVSGYSSLVFLEAGGYLYGAEFVLVLALVLSALGFLLSLAAFVTKEKERRKRSRILALVLLGTNAVLSVLFALFLTLERTNLVPGFGLYLYGIYFLVLFVLYLVLYRTKKA